MKNHSPKFGLVLVVSIVCILFSKNNYGQKAIPEEYYHEQAPLTIIDSAWLSRIAVIEAVTQIKDSITLPPSVNNAELQYFPPVFSQGQYASCGQASGVSYNFCYMINRARNLPADVPENQYPTHYHWNFTNGGYGWYGSSYFHSFEILRTNGTPNVADYGGIDYGGGSRWMTGYEYYYNGMHNRIEGVYKIDVSTPEGIETLKHWLHNHLDGSPTGGVASFYANASHYQYLPPDTPEAGRPVISTFWGLPSHAWVIVGYNDSIRWDYNNDGLYTNHLDINGDGIVDVRDWEIGGVWVANSWGQNWGEGGFTFVMYRCLAESVFNGGIWDNSVHILKVKDNYSPLLTAKIKLKHTSREMIKVQAGVSRDISLKLPQHILEFPIFNFQGGNRFMQGGSGEEHKTIEFGLDITPLLDHVHPGEEVKFFLQIVENDPLNQHEGEIVSFSIIDYTAEEPVEHEHNGANIRLINNSTTTLGITAAINFDKVEIETDDLPAIEPGTPYSFDLQASGGLEPYMWALLQDYTEHSIPYAGSDKIGLKSNTYPGWNQWQSTELDFTFPFYGREYEKITAYVNGFIMFEEQPHPYPYWLEPGILFRSYECIAPFLARNLILDEENGDQIWFESFNDHIRVNWKLTYEYFGYELPVVFSAILREDGSIEFHYEAFSFEDHCVWLAGVSKGDKINHTASILSGTQHLNQHTAIAFKPADMPENLNVDEQGVLIYGGGSLEKIYDINVRVSDYRGITDSKTLQLSDHFNIQFVITEESLIAGSDADIEIIVKNISTTDLDEIRICFESSADDFITWLNPCFEKFSLDAGETKNFSRQGIFNISPSTPGNHLLDVKCNVEWDGQTRQLTRHLNIKKSNLGFTSIVVEGAVQNNVNPGENYTLRAGVANLGNAPAQNVVLEIVSDDPFLILYPPFLFEAGDLLPLGGQEINIDFRVHPKAIPGFKSGFTLRLKSADLDDIELYFQFVFGGTKILIIDADPLSRSAGQMRDALNHIGYANQLVNQIGVTILDYEVGFVNLGTFPDRHYITADESEILTSFLNQGGKLYLEGSSAWRLDPQHPIQGMFGITGKPQGWVFGVDSLAGNPGSFTEKFNIRYKGTNLRMDNMEPSQPEAVILFSDVPSGLHYSIAYEAGNYKTIGSTFEFGGLYQSASDSIPVELMKEYLHYFGLETYRLAANFEADKYLLCDGETVSFTLKPSGNVEEVLWEFEGGTPATSNEFSPEVRYDDHGNYGVKLIVSDGITSDTIFIEGIISVEACSGITTPEKDLFRLYPNPAGNWIKITSENAGLKDATIQIFNINGQLLYETLKPGQWNSEQVLIDVSSLKNGVYLVRISNYKNSYSTRFIIAR